MGKRYDWGLYLPANAPKTAAGVDNRSEEGKRIFNTRNTTHRSILDLADQLRKEREDGS